MPNTVNRVIRGPGLFLPLAMLAAANAVADDRVFDKKFEVSGRGTLLVDTHTGSIKVTGSDANEVVIHASLRGGRRAVDRFEITAHVSGNDVTVRGRRDRDDFLSLSWLFGGGMDVRYTISVPRNYDVQVVTSGGDLELSDFNGRAYGRTSGGNVNVAGVNGLVEIYTSGGNVRGAKLTGDVNARTSGGNVRFEGVVGPVNARTSGGDVRMINIDGRLNARTSGGDVDAELLGVNRGVELRTSGGDITVRVPKDFAAIIDARTSGGDVDCDLPVTSTGTVSKHRRALNGTLNGGGESLHVRTSGGDIEIRAQR